MKLLFFNVVTKRGWFQASVSIQSLSPQMFYFLKHAVSQWVFSVNHLLHSTILSNALIVSLTILDRMLYQFLTKK